MPVKKRKDKRRPQIEPDVLAYFLERTDERPPELFTDEAEFWSRARDAVLDQWIAEHPGTRPAAWWRHEAPELRRRLGGAGTPAHEVLAHVEQHDRGIPSAWVEPWMVDYYAGRAVDVRGVPIGQEFVGQEFVGVAIDPDDPPEYESEAAYLERLGLLSAAERRRLPADAFEPEWVTSAEPED